MIGVLVLAVLAIAIVMVVLFIWQMRATAKKQAVAADIATAKKHANTLSPWTIGIAVFGSCVAAAALLIFLLRAASLAPNEKESLKGSGNLKVCSKVQVQDPDKQARNDCAKRRKLTDKERDSFRGPSGA